MELKGKFTNAVIHTNDVDQNTINKEETSEEDKNIEEQENEQ